MKMETKVHSDVPIEEKFVRPDSVKIIDEKFVISKAIKKMPPVTTTASLEPITPDTNLRTPITLVNSSPENEDMQCHTPVYDVFDPFAPGPEKLLNAPFRIKLVGESQIHVMRRLNFDLTVDHSDSSNEEMLLEIMYDDLLEFIVSKQEGIIDTCSDDVYKTPDSGKRLTGIAETCPDAPMRCSRKTMKIDQSICRKLEFDLE